MSYYRYLGDDPAPAAAEPAAEDSRVMAVLARIEARQAALERDRKIATYAAVAGALFAAGRLGILAIPFVKRRR